MRNLRILLPLLFLGAFQIAPSTLQAQTWTQLTTTGNIPATSNASSIYIPQRNEMVVFGGATSAGRVNHVWILDLNTATWREVVSNSATLPTGRHTQNAVYDRANDRMLIFSGQATGLFNDVWAFTFADSSWTNLAANGNGAGKPLLRYGGITEFDSLNQQFVTFAGSTTSGRFNDTWTFDLNGNSWTERTQMVFPTKRCLFNSALAHDRRQTIIYGGQGTGNFDDIWACDLDTYVWTDMTPAVTPPGRHFSSVIYRGNGEVVIFGGNGANQNQFSGARNDVWSYSMDAQAWTEILPAGATPDRRVGHVAEYLPSEDKMVIFGGNLSNGSRTNDVWIFDFAPAVSIDRPAPEAALLAYPNPAQEALTLELNLPEITDLDLRVYNQQGQLVKRIQENQVNAGSSQRQLDLQDLGPGIYFLEVVGQGLRSKFVKL